MGLYGNKFQDIIHEGTLYKDSTINIMTQIDPNRNYGLDMAYFKVADNSNYINADKVARIKLFSPEYTPDHSGDGKESWKFNNKEKKMINNILLSRPNVGKYKRAAITIWELMVIEYIIQTGLVLPKNFKLIMPDYTLLK